MLVTYFSTLIALPTAEDTHSINGRVELAIHKTHLENLRFFQTRTGRMSLVESPNHVDVPLHEFDDTSSSKHAHLSEIPNAENSSDVAPDEPKFVLPKSLSDSAEQSCQLAPRALSERGSRFLSRITKTS